ncbi:hypothetical protein DYI37_14565 [Fulvimarina endophytica]|uniref:Uncharacterized protein n=1 Tax=Fulvimarina endophytica TaxID=2293836 RepID=A0A371X276_9HYPH|nr:hypothetical protein [Fulvimarina endophytica]RFC63144.1 hypothetical protein DYI37_14565 [Fulvimarina endophytica]
MASDHESGRTETVTRNAPRAPSTLDDGMPIADKRVGFGKGAGKWLAVFGVVVIAAILIFTGTV